MLHDIVKTLKAKLEAEFGPLNAETTKTSKFIISRSPLAAEVQASCDAAIEKADAVSATLSNASLDGKGISSYMDSLFKFFNIKFLQFLGMHFPSRLQNDGSGNVSGRIGYTIYL